jgi:hypothetical protein
LDTRSIPFPGEPDRTCDTVADITDATDTEGSWDRAHLSQHGPGRDSPADLLGRGGAKPGRTRCQRIVDPHRRGPGRALPAAIHSADAGRSRSEYNGGSNWRKQSRMRGGGRIMQAWLWSSQS